LTKKESRNKKTPSPVVWGEPDLARGRKRENSEGVDSGFVGGKVDQLNGLGGTFPNGRD